MSRNFDKGNPDFIDFGNPSYLDLSGNKIAMSEWVRIASSGEEMKVFSKWAPTGQSYLLSVQGNGKLLFAVNNGGVKIAFATTDLDDGEWHHVAGVYDVSSIRGYIDGVQEGSQGASGNLNSTT